MSSFGAKSVFWGLCGVGQQEAFPGILWNQWELCAGCGQWLLLELSPFPAAGMWELSPDQQPGEGGVVLGGVGAARQLLLPPKISWDAPPFKVLDPRTLPGRPECLYWSETRQVWQKVDLMDAAEFLCHSGSVSADSIP